MAIDFTSEFVKGAAVQLVLGAIVGLVIALLVGVGGGSAVVVLFGLGLAFLGWAVHEAFLKLFGFFIGFVVGGGVTLVLFAGGSGGTGGSTEGALLTTLLMAVLLGVVSAYVALAAERLFVSVTGLLVAMGVPYLYSVIAGSPLFAYLSLPLGLVGAYVAWRSYKGMVVLMTAVLGGGLVAVGVTLLNGDLGLVSFVLTTTVGAGYQLSGASVESGELGQTTGVRVQRSVTSVLREFWAPIALFLLFFLAALIILLGVDVSTTVLLAFGVAGPAVLAAVNTVRDGSLRSSVAVGIVPAIWAGLVSFRQYSSQLTRYRQGIITNKPRIAEYLDPVFLLTILGAGIGLAAVGVLIGKGYNRFVASTSDGAPADSDAV